MQEAGRRAGTENVLGIVGLGAAAKLVSQEQQATAQHMAALRDSLQQQLVKALPEVVCFCTLRVSPFKAPPSLLCISTRSK